MAYIVLCDICKKKDKDITAVVVCHQCRQFFCSDCKENHQLFSTTETHHCLFIQNEVPQASNSFVVDTDIRESKQINNVKCPTQRILEPIPSVKKDVQQPTKNNKKTVYSRTNANDKIGIGTATKFHQTDIKPLELIRPSCERDGSSKVNEGNIVYSKTHAYDGMSVQEKIRTHQTDHKRLEPTQSWPSGEMRQKVCSSGNDNRLASTTCSSENDDRLASTTCSSDNDDRLASTTKDSDFLRFKTKDFKGSCRKNPKTDKRIVTKFHTKSNSDDDEPVITSLRCMSDDSIVLIDHKNKKLKWFWPTYEFRTDIEVKGKSQPYGVTPVNKDKVAVTCGELIKFFTLNESSIKKCQKTFKLDLDGYGYGISYHREKFAVVCNFLKKQESYSSIRILNNEGVQIQLINCNVLGSTPSLVKVTDSVIFCDKGIFVLEKKDRKLCCLGYNKNSWCVWWERYVSGTPISFSLACGSALVACRQGCGHHVEKVPLTQDENFETIMSEKDGILSPKLISFQEKAKRVLISETGLSVIKVFLFEEGSKE